MRALRLFGDRDARLAEMEPPPPPGPGELVLRSRSEPVIGLVRVSAELTDAVQKLRTAVLPLRKL